MTLSNSINAAGGRQQRRAASCATRCCRATAIPPGGKTWLTRIAVEAYSKRASREVASRWLLTDAGGGMAPGRAEEGGKCADINTCEGVPPYGGGQATRMEE